MFKKILVPLDSSSLAEQAIPTAVQLARANQGSITLLYVLEKHAIFVPDGPEMMGHTFHASQTVYEQSEIAAREYLNNTKNEMACVYPDLTWQMEIEKGDAASLIIDVAAELKTNLIVMSTHGYSGLTRWVLGSVTERVLRHAPCPVLIVRDKQPIHKILITLDGSALSESCLPYGLAIAESCGAAVTLLQVDEASKWVDEVTVTGLNRNEEGLGDQYRYMLQHESEDYLNRLFQRHDHENLTLQTAVCFGKPAATILNYAEESEVDLIVMSTHGRTGLARWRYGSVTEKVLHSADCALLIYRPEEIEKP